MKASDYITAHLENLGIDTVFGYIGGMITHLVDSLSQSPRIRFIQTYHEQTAAIAAEGYALESGKFGVAIATSGPGATNMVTGIADAYFGSIPVLFITGQVNTHEYKYGKPIRQQGFQETDVVSLVKPITKYAVMVDEANELRYELEKAIHIATSGRKGPVLIDLPMDISRADIDPAAMKSYTPHDAEISYSCLEIVLDAIKSSKHPMVLLGGGATGCSREIENFVRKHNLPVVTSLMARGIINEDYENHMGMIGAYGNRCANMAFEHIDFLLALGTRLDTRQTGARLQDFMPDGTIIHVDIDEQELACHRLSNRIPVHSDVHTFISRLNEAEPVFHHEKEWLVKLHALKEQYNQEQEVCHVVSNKAPYRFIEHLNKISGPNDIFTADIGQNQMWAAQSLKLKQGQRLITSGGLAPMGFSLPAAIGIAFANSQKKIYCLNGDGGFHMALQSLMLISQYDLNIKVIVLNNSTLGMITQFQHLYFNDRMPATTAKGGYLVPDLKHLAQAYGLKYTEACEETLESANPHLENAGPVLLHYMISPLTTVSPKLEYNKPIFLPSPEI